MLLSCLRRERFSPRLIVLVIIGVLTALLSIAWTIRSPRKWKPHEVPVAFWAWRNQAASQSDIQSAVQQAGAKIIFLRAGQVDYQEGSTRRIRAVTGRFPRGVELHLVYNGTRALLSQLEMIDGAALAATIEVAYVQDLQRANQDQSQVAGIQIDIDTPTRLLKRYARMLRLLRERLPKNTKISITGLPTWMNSPDLIQVLQETDFWIPQCYGAEIPRRLQRVIPISSGKGVVAAVTRAQQLGEPFYAGLAAYSYVLLYAPDGTLVTVRGDMDPPSIAADPNLELVDRAPFEPPDTIEGKITSEWRYVYRARANGLTGDLSMRAGDSLVVDLPTTESLREAAGAVREFGGDLLLGICIFRLPTPDDPSTLSLAKVTSALYDQKAAAEFSVAAKLLDQNGQKQGPHSLLVTVTNAGITDTLLNDSIQVGIKVPVGTRVMKVEGFNSFETQCRTDGASTRQPCSERLANHISLRAPALSATRKVEALLLINGTSFRELSVEFEAHLEDGRVFQSRDQVLVQPGEAK